MVLGIVLGLGAATLQALAYVFVRVFHVRNRPGTPSLLAMGHVVMGVVSLVALPMLWPRHIAPMRAWLGPLLMAAGFYLAGQVFLFLTLKRTEASRVSPLLGLKIVMLAAITVGFLGHSLSPWQWIAVALGLSAAFALNTTGAPVGPWALAGVLATCLGYSLSDLNVKRLVLSLDMTNVVHASFVAVCLSYVVCGLAVSPLLVRVPPRRAGDWVRALPFAVSWLVAMTLLFCTFALVGVVFGNILQSARGLISILMGAALARAGLLHVESHAAPRVFWHRLAAGLLMCAAIALFLLGPTQ